MTKVEGISDLLNAEFRIDELSKLSGIKNLKFPYLSKNPTLGKVSTHFFPITFAITVLSFILTTFQESGFLTFSANILTIIAITLIAGVLLILLFVSWFIKNIIFSNQYKYTPRQVRYQRELFKSLLQLDAELSESGEQLLQKKYLERDPDIKNKNENDEEMSNETLMWVKFDPDWNLLQFTKQIDLNDIVLFVVVSPLIIASIFGFYLSITGGGWFLFLLAMGAGFYPGVVLWNIISKFRTYYKLKYALIELYELKLLHIDSRFDALHEYDKESNSNEYFYAVSLYNQYIQKVRNLPSFPNENFARWVVISSSLLGIFFSYLSPLISEAITGIPFP